MVVLHIDADPVGPTLANTQYDKVAMGVSFTFDQDKFSENSRCRQYTCASANPKSGAKCESQASAEAQHRILARAADQLGPIALGAETGAIAKTTVTGQHQNLVRASSQIQLLPQLAHRRHEALRQVVLLEGLFISLPSFRLGFL